MTARADLILGTVTDLTDRLLDREGDDELFTGDIESAVAAGEITVADMTARFSQALQARLLGHTT
jgi:hypothetical protein